MSLVRRLTLAATLAVVAATARAYAEEPARPAWADDVAALRLEGDAAKRVERTWALLAKKPDVATLRAELARLPTWKADEPKGEIDVAAGRGQGRQADRRRRTCPRPTRPRRRGPCSCGSTAPSHATRTAAVPRAPRCCATPPRWAGSSSWPPPARRTRCGGRRRAWPTCARPLRTWRGSTASIPTASRRPASRTGRAAASTCSRTIPTRTRVSSRRWAIP